MFSQLGLIYFRMGSGASAEHARTTVTTMLTGKPADASDIKVILCHICLSLFLMVFKRIWSKLVLKLEICEELLAIFRIN